MFAQPTYGFNVIQFPNFQNQNQTSNNNHQERPFSASTYSTTSANAHNLGNA